jgi:hypothetical protein
VPLLEITRSTYLFRQSSIINNYRFKEHFDRWMEIFTTTTDELFVGVLPKKQNYANMAEMFNYKIDYFKMLLKTEIF